MHVLLEQIFSTGVTELPNGSMEPVHSSISRDDCAAVERAITQSGARSAIEVGMAFGISALAIADALSRNGPARLVSIDPQQTSSWRGSGLHLLRRAGLGDIAEVIEEPSQLALPRLAARGDRFDFAFIDGWHTFDHALIDFFYCDLMLETGGFMIVDDVGYPAINSLVRFILSNRDYELVEVTRYPDAKPAGNQFRRDVKRILRPLARTDRDPTPTSENLFRGIEGAIMATLRKRGNDTRAYDHFEQF